MGEVVVLALTAALNPTELAGAMVMMLLPNPGRLLFGYWLGAMVSSNACGLAIVFALRGPAEHATTHTIGPGAWLVVSVLLVVAALALAKGEDVRLRKWREARREKKGKGEKKTPKWEKTLREGNAWHTFGIGILLSLPGASYLAALDRLIHLHYSTLVTVLVIIGFNLVQNILIEIPLLALRIWPEETPAAIERAKAWVSSHGRRYASWGLGLIGVAGAIPSLVVLV